MIPYIDYHTQSYQIGDIDPAYPMLRYICDRFELNMEQRYWLAFLYGCCYCGPTVFYIYNEFPDYENVDVNRLERWWKAHKHQCLFQTDRMRIRSNNQFIPAFVSYRALVGECQSRTLHRFVYGGLPQKSYDTMYKILLKNVKYFGRYSMFLWLECIQRLTGIAIQPTEIDWKNANNCLNGLLLSHDLHEVDWCDLSTAQLANKLLSDTIDILRITYPKYHTDVWNVETTLCAYYKYLHGKRYIGFYRDRQLNEINTMAKNVSSGVCWDVLYDFRNEYQPFKITYNKE
jgi:hypothetical protein